MWKGRARHHQAREGQCEVGPGQAGQEGREGMGPRHQEPSQGQHSQAHGTRNANTTKKQADSNQKAVFAQARRGL